VAFVPVDADLIRALGLDPGEFDLQALGRHQLDEDQRYRPPPTGMPWREHDHTAE
jgi:hypothetical protein